MKNNTRIPLVLTKIAVTTLAAAFGATLSVAAAGSASADNPPAAGGHPGDVLSVQPYTYREVPFLPSPTTAWKILYHSTDATGHPDVVSGTVIVPNDHRTGTRPLMTYAFGTQGMGDQCAPSASLSTGHTVGADGIVDALKRGWAVAVTDYQGLGTPGDHTYLVGRAEATAVLDAARAAQRLPDAQRYGVSAKSPVGVMGYSQGGHASAWAAEIARSYAPDLDIKGITSGGVPANELADALATRNSNPDPGLSMMVAIGHNAAYPELRLDSYLTAEGRQLEQRVRTGCVLDDAAAGIGKTPAEIYLRNPIDSPDWQRRLGQDTLGTQAPAYPVFLYHGTSDQVVAFARGQQLRKDWCARGATVEWHAYPGADHFAAASQGAKPAADWMADRFAGIAAPDNCAG